LEIEDLEQHGAPLLKSDTITVSESENSVVVHHGVHVLDPDGIDVTVVENPSALSLVLIGLRSVAFLENL